jgi:NitT/TauT family transport system ATP-binding protein
MEGAEKMIEFKNVSFSYGKKQVLKDFNLKIADGERLCLFGESGRGKTTVLRLICSLEKADSGILTVESKAISAVFQEDRLLPFLTVGQNIKMFSDKDNIDYVLKKLKLTEAEELYPSELSGGMARRVSLARALCRKADIYIFDEPFAGLDSINIAVAAELINEMTDGKTVVSVLHERQYAEKLNCAVFEM